MESGHRPPGPALVSLSAAFQKLCGLTSEGAPYSFGLFGTPPFGDRKALRSVNELTLGGIWPVGTDSTAWHFKSLTVGIDHVCGLREDGSAYCWGWNEVGALGKPIVAH